MSSGPFLAFGGIRAPIAALTLPANIWVADLQFAESDELPATAELTVGDLTLLGTAYRQADFAGSRYVRVVGGYGGWHRSVAQRAYALPGGVQMSLVLRDLAAEIGERVTIGTDRVLGDHFVREAGPAHRILRQLAGREWYVDDDGTTRIQVRPSAVVQGDYLVNSFDGARGELVIATESYTEWRPGNTFSNALVPSVQTIATVRLESDNAGMLRHTILTVGPDSDSDRMTAALREIILGELPQLNFLGVYGYTVLESDGETVTCRPANAALALPALVRIQLRSGVAGMRCKPATGTRLVVGFIDGDPAQPYVAGGFEQPEHARPVICYSDVVNVPGVGNVPLTPGPTTAAELTTVPVAKAQRSTS